MNHHYFEQVSVLSVFGRAKTTLKEKAIFINTLLLIREWIGLTLHHNPQLMNGLNETQGFVVRRCEDDLLSKT